MKTKCFKPTRVMILIFVLAFLVTQMGLTASPAHATSLRLSITEVSPALPSGWTSGNLYSVWGSGTGDIYAVGYGNKSSTNLPLIDRYDGSNWTSSSPSLPSGSTSGNFYGVWGSSAGDVYAVGNSNNGEFIPLVSHFDGSNWTSANPSLPTGWLGGSLNGIWGSSAGDVYAVGNGNSGLTELPLLYHYDGNTWTSSTLSLPSGCTSGNLSGVWGTGPSDIYVVGTGNTAVPLIYHYDGSSWTSSSLTQGGLYGVWGSNTSDVYAVGNRTNILFEEVGLASHYDGSTWTDISPNLPNGWTSEWLRGVWGSGVGDVYAVGTGNNSVPVIDHYDGSSWISVSANLPGGWTSGALSSVWGSGAGNIYAVGFGNNGTTILPLIYHSLISPTNADLGNLVLSTGALTPAFAAGTTSYTELVPNAVTSLTVRPTTADSQATVTINGTPVASGSASSPINLTLGLNTITVVVTAPDGTTTKTYTVTVNVASSNASLSNLVLSTGALTPAFATGTTSYTQSVANTVTSLTVTPTVADPTATVTVNGTPVESGSASSSISLTVGNNTIKTVVTAQDGITTKAYTVTVTRAPSSNADLNNLVLSTGALTPAFDTGTTIYTQSVSGTITSLTVTPTVADTTATVTVNGTPVASGSASGTIKLTVGLNTITTVVTAQDGTTTKTYTVTVHVLSSNANLSNLVLSTGALTPVFATGTTSYTQSVANTITSLTVKPTLADTTATVTVNGTPVASGSASGPISLSAGNNTITIVVTAQDGVTTKTYTVTVTPLPGPFNKSSPAIAAINQPANPTLSWTSSTGATSYQYCYDATNDNACTSWISNGTSTSANLSGLLPNTTYYWQVRAVIDSGQTYANGTSTAFWSFHTMSLPVAFSKSSPANSALKQPTSVTLAWAASPGAASYEYCYDTINNNSCDSSWISVSATSVNISNLSNNTTYYWQVRATNSVGLVYANGNGNTWWNFKVLLAPPTLSSPSNGAINVALRPNFSWSDPNTSGVTGYTIQISSSNTFASILVTGNPTVTSYTPTLNLPAGTVLYWRVQVKGTNGPSTWSTFGSFTTQ